MASTNKTNNFNLSQFIETDKPTFLGDYNTDMNKIDDAMQVNKLVSENNNNSIGNLQELNTENKLNLVKAINEVNENVSSGGDLKTKVDALELNVNNLTTDLESTNAKIGDLNTLNTINKDSVVRSINQVYNEAHPLVNLYNSLRNLVTWQISNKEIGTDNLTLVSGSGTFEASDIKFNYTNAKNQFRISGSVILRQFTTSSMLEFNVNNTGLETFSNELYVVGYAQNNTSNIIYPLYAKVQNNKLVVTSEFSNTTPADYNIVFIDAVRNV